MAKLLIIGYGNPARGDDGLGPLVAEHIESLKSLRHWQHIDVLTAYQLQIENVMDLVDYQTVLFIDADSQINSPYLLTRCQPEVGQSYTSHALTPDALLAVYQQVYKTAPPACYLLKIAGHAFELGQPLSSIATENLRLAKDFVEHCCQRSEQSVLLDDREMMELSTAYA